MSLRDEIAFSLIRFYNAQERETDFEARVQNTEQTADAILALVAEALTSPESLDRAVDGYWSADPGVPRDYGDMQRAITAALAAAGVKGEGDGA